MVKALLKELNNLNEDDIFETNNDRIDDGSVTKLKNKIKKYENGCNDVHNYE